MQSAEHLWRYAAVATLCTGLAGCASLSEPLTGLKEMITGAPATSVAEPAQAATAPTRAAASAPAATLAQSATQAAARVASTEPAPAAADTEPPVNAAAQRAFDEARRLLRAGRSADAERAFKALIESNPELGGPHANLGLIYRNAGKLPEAVAALERAVQASPEQPLYFNQLGLAYRANGQFVKARGAYERAIELDAKYAAPVLNLGILNDLYLGDAARAMELYARYLTLAPGQEAVVNKWMAELKNRKPGSAAPVKKEQS